MPTAQHYDPIDILGEIGVWRFFKQKGYMLIKESAIILHAS
jgi:hypothetical protein